MASLSVNHHSAISVASQHATASHSVYEIITARIRAADYILGADGGAA